MFLHTKYTIQKSKVYVQIKMLLRNTSKNFIGLNRQRHSLYLDKTCANLKKNEKKPMYMGLCIPKKWKILKSFSGALS